MSAIESSEQKKNPSIKWMAIIVAILSFALYARSLKSELVYDASVQITSDDFIHTRSNLIDVFTFRVMARDVLDFNRPVHLQLLMLESLVFGRNPMGYHLTSILLHAINSALVFLVILRMFEDYQRLRRIKPAGSFAASAAFLGAMIFSALPACVEAIAEPSFREDPLSTFFTLLALFLSTKVSDQVNRNRWLWAGIIFCCMYAIGSKENGVVAPVLVGIYFLLFRPGEKRSNWLIPVLGGLLVCGLFTIARFALETKDSMIFGKGPPMFAGDLGTYFRSQGHIWRLYIEAYFYPFNLCADYTPYSISGYTVVGSWVIIGLVLLVQIGLSCLSRVALFGSIFFWLAIFPVSNIFRQYHPAADRYLYMPAIGLAIAAAAVIYALGSFRILRGSIWVVVLAVVVLCAKVTYERQEVFSNELALWKDTDKHNPFSYHAQNGLGYYYLYQNDLKNAKKWLKSASLTNPAMPDPYCGLAVIDFKSGEKYSAMYFFNKCLAADPDYLTPEIALTKIKIDKRQAELIAPLIETYKLEKRQ